MLPAFGTTLPDTRVEQRRLAGAVRSDQGADLASAQIEGHAVHRDQATKPNLDASARESRGGSATIVALDEDRMGARQQAGEATGKEQDH